MSVSMTGRRMTGHHQSPEPARYIKINNDINTLINKK